MTPQSHVHVGHARVFVVFDVLRRLLERNNLRVIHVQNFTDIDDKIIARAKEMEIQPSEVAEKNIQEYFEVLDKLNVKRANHYPRVTEHMSEIISLIKRLIEGGHAYVAEGDVYFSVRSFKDYGKLSHQKVEDLLAGARIEPLESKHSPEDFALWKKAKPGEPSWDSPWGKGRPGWAIECSAMAEKYLGPTLDVHGGGQDLIFPHHENEIAQSESATGRELARFWVHVGLVNTSGAKMSKSTGNVTNLIEIYKTREPLALRLALLGTHYRAPLDYDEVILTQAEAGLTRIRNSLKLLSEAEKVTKKGESTHGEELQRLMSEFLNRLEDDIDTPAALSVLYETVKLSNRLAQQEGVAEGDLALARSTLEQMAHLLGILEERTTTKSVDYEPLIRLLLEVRDNSRAKKDFQTADLIRERLAAIGVIIEDTPAGTRWTLDSRRAQTGSR